MNLDNSNTRQVVYSPSGSILLGDLKFQYQTISKKSLNKYNSQYLPIIRTFSWVWNTSMAWHGIFIIFAVMVIIISISLIIFDEKDIVYNSFDSMQ